MVGSSLARIALDEPPLRPLPASARCARCGGPYEEYLWRRELCPPCDRRRVTAIGCALERALSFQPPA